jgi:hypothetical protein
VLVAQQPDTTTIDLTTAPRVTWHDHQQQLPATPPPLPSPQHRVSIKLLPDDTAIAQPTLPDDMAVAQPTAPTITLQTQHQPAPLPLPPWTSFDVTSVRGTVIIPPSTSAAVFNNPATADRADLLISLLVSPNSKMNSNNLWTTTLQIDDTRVRPLWLSHPPPSHLPPHHFLTLTPTPTPTLTPTTTPTLPQPQPRLQLNN